MIIKKIRLNNFRCFQNRTFAFDKRFIVIEGKNGSGKTSLLEGIYYSCYLRSFRTRLNRELIHFDQNYFFVQTDFAEEVGVSNQIQVGYSSTDGKLVKFNQKPIQSYKQIISYYKVICVIENDLQLVGGAPECRRSFLNQSSFLSDFNFVSRLRIYKQILEQRNTFLLKHSANKLTDNVKKELYTWTKQLWEKSIILQKARVDLLNTIEQRVNELLQKYFFKDIAIKLDYGARNIKLHEHFEQFWTRYNKHLLEKEFRWMRSLFGFHLDDFSIIFKKRKAKFYASRGQQKLILFLLKASQLFDFEEQKRQRFLLLDDFLTDFDEQILEKALKLLKELDCQVFLTCPFKSFVTTRFENSCDLQNIEL